MTAFNFKPEFVPKIKSGEKTQTIRQTKRCDIGDTMQLYTGQRTKKCRKIMDAVCTDVFEIKINSGGVIFDRPISVMSFAKADGFKTVVEMRHFFLNQYGLPFTGYVYKWRKA